MTRCSSSVWRRLSSGVKRAPSCGAPLKRKAQYPVFHVLLRVSRRRRLRLFFKTLAPTSTTTCNAAASPTFLMRLTFQVTMTRFYSRHGSTYGGTSAVIQAEGTKLPSNVSTNGCTYSVGRGAPASSYAAEQEHGNTRRSGQTKWWCTFKVWNLGLWWRRGRGR